MKQYFNGFIQVFYKKSLVFMHERKAAVMVEFALLLPIMFLVWFGLSMAAETSNAYRKASILSYAVGDMIAQSTEVDQKLLDNIYAASSEALWPLGFEKITVSVISIITDDQLRQYLSWAKLLGDVQSTTIEDFSNKPKCYNMQGWSKDKLVNEMAGNYIYVISKINFTPSVSTLILGSIYQDTLGDGKRVIEKRYYIRPRYVDIVKFPGQQCDANPYNK